MAASEMALAFILLSGFLPFPPALAAVTCEELPKDLCAFAVSSAAKRCLRESIHRGGGRTEYQCRTSEVEVERRLRNWVETDECVRACGVSRDATGISSDALLEPEFAGKLCSGACYQNCLNIVDLYFNLAAGEGVFLPDLCAVHKLNPRRAMAELLSSGAAFGAAAASAPTSY